MEWWELPERELIRLLKLRKKRKRNFVRPYSWRWKKLDESWRYPDGIDNKVRLQYKWQPPLPEPGYGSPRLVRHLHPCKKEPVIVYKLSDLFKLDPQIHAVLIASGVSRKKRLEIVKFATKFGFRVINPGKLPLPAVERRREEVAEKEEEISFEEIVKETEKKEEVRTEEEKKEEEK